VHSADYAFPLVPRSENDLRNALAHYYHLITRIDEEIGRVVDELERTGELDETVIVFTSDHGDFAGEHGLMIKGLAIYESIQRIPMIVRVPGGPEGVRTDAFVESVDLFPTLCSLCGLDVPQSVEGRPMPVGGPFGNAGGSAGEVATTRPATVEGRRHAFCESWGTDTSRALSIVTRRYRLTYFPQVGSGELFDHDEDPGEMKSVYEELRYASVRDDLLLRRVHAPRAPERARGEHANSKPFDPQDADSRSAKAVE
jgi:arylsulfatase A-like enzyme